MTKSGFGNIRLRPSGRYEARYTGPDGVMYRGPVTYVNRKQAVKFLADERSAMGSGEWVPPPLRDVAPEVDPLDTLTFGPYADAWIKGRRTKTGEPIRPRTREDYERVLDNLLRPTFGDRTIRSITKVDVRRWHADACPDAPTYRAHAYGLLRAILTSAVEDEVITVNPCQIKGASTVNRKRPIRTLTTMEYELLVKSMPERLRAMVILATWAALRFGELAELRRGDVDIALDDSAGVIRVRRGVTRTKAARHRGRPKSDPGMRDVTIPPHIVPVVSAHLREHTGPGLLDLLFPAADGTSNLAPSTLYGSFYPARDAAGRPDLRFHDLRHTGAVLAAQAGATIADLMARLGHSTPGAAMRYQHTAAERDRDVAAEMSRRASAM